MTALLDKILAAEDELKGPSPDLWFGRLDSEHERLDVLLASTLESDPDSGLSLVGAVWPYWLARGEVDQGREWLSRFLSAVDSARRTEARAKALYGAGTLAFIQGDRDSASTLHGESHAIARELGDRSLEADALIGLARVAVLDSDAIAMEQQARASLEAAQSAEDEIRQATALHHVVEALRRQQRYEEALPLYHESVDLHRALGDRRGVALELHNLGNIARLTGDAKTAASRYRESLELAREFENVRLVGYCLLGLAHVAAEEGDWSQVARLLGASDASFEAAGAVLDPDYVEDRDQTRRRAEAGLGSEAYAAAARQGAADLESARPGP